MIRNEIVRIRWIIEEDSFKNIDQNNQMALYLSMRSPRRGHHKTGARINIKIYSKNHISTINYVHQWLYA